MPFFSKPKPDTKLKPTDFRSEPVPKMQNDRTSRPKPKRVLEVPAESELGPNGLPPSRRDT